MAVLVVFIVSGKSGTDSAIDRIPIAIKRTWAYSIQFTHLRTLVTQLRASAHHWTESSAVLRSNAYLLHSNALAEPATLLLECNWAYCPALEHTSTSCINIPKAVCSIFISFSFDKIVRLILIVLSVCFEYVSAVVSCF